MLLLLFNDIPRVYFDDYRYIFLEDKLYNIVNISTEYSVIESNTNYIIEGKE